MKGYHGTKAELIKSLPPNELNKRSGIMNWKPTRTLTRAEVLRSERSRSVERVLGVQLQKSTEEEHEAGDELETFHAKTWMKKYAWQEKEETSYRCDYSDEYLQRIVKHAGRIGATSEKTRSCCAMKSWRSKDSSMTA